MREGPRLDLKLVEIGDGHARFVARALARTLSSLTSQNRLTDLLTAEVCLAVRQSLADIVAGFHADGMPEPLITAYRIGFLSRFGIEAPSFAYLAALNELLPNARLD
jgi:hypothetical protein